MAEFIIPVDELKYKNLKNQLGDVPLEDCIMLAEQADQFVADMNPFDPARAKFQRDSRMWWQYAWLLSCVAGTFRLNSPHVMYRNFLVAFPKKQPYLDDSIFRDWLRARETDDVTMEFPVYMPVYLRPDEVEGYALAMMKKICDIPGRLVNAEFLEVTEETEN